ncbi:unnamed protein product, partial [Symbiodinium microadriaticum]
LAADGEEATTRPGPSLQLQAPAVALSEEGDWIAAPSAEPLSVTVVDFPASVTSLLSPVEHDSFLGTFFSETDPGLYPLASDVLRQARQWILAEGAGASSGYQTAASEPPAGDARRQRAKRPTVALLAQQQASLTEVVARLSDQLAMMQKAAQGAPADRPDRPAPTRVTTGAEARRAPLSEHLGALGEPEDEDLAPQHPAQGPVVKLPPFQTVPKSLAHALGPPPPARPAALIPKPPEVDLDAQLAAAISSGELPNAPAQPDLTTAMMAQSQALLTLVGHLAQGTDPVKERALLRMAPAGVGSTEPFSLCRYYERYGGFAKHRELALVAWQVAISFDLIMAGNTNGAADVIGLLAVYLDQLVLDQGATTVAWLLTLQQDPPQVLYSEPASAPSLGVQPFSPLADQKWITSALGYLREMDLIASRRAETKGKPKRPPGLPPAPLPVPPTQDETALSKKQLRAAQWAAKRAAAGTPPAKRGTHLVARFRELSEFLLSCGIGPEAYGSAPPEPLKERPLVPHSPDGPECLRPYRPLQADAIVLHGEANWDISPYLAPGMLLAYRDPVLLETFPGTGGPTPVFQHEDPSEVLRLLKVWDAKHLLTLRPGVLPDVRCARVFGAYKSPGKFRQIGDRRGANSLEAKLDGVSHLLPQGFLLTRLHVPRFTHQLLGSSTDRKDFYTQCRVSQERAFSNAVKPAFVLGDFAGTKAHDDYIQWVRSEAGLSCSQRFMPEGVSFEGAHLKSALLAPTAPVHGCFNSLFQGDAAGVELATAAHVSFLEAAQVLPSFEGGRLLARHPVHPYGPWSGVVIDDLFSISCEPADLADPRSCDSARVVDTAKVAYGRAGIKGSDDKDVFGASLFCIAGAECDSGRAAVKEGLVTIGSPLSKRLALSLVSLLTASHRWVSEELSSMLAGGWISVLMFRRCAMAVAGSIFEQRVDQAAGDSGSALVRLSPSARQELVLLAVLAPLLSLLCFGAYTHMRPDLGVIKALWLSADARGFYTKLDGPLRASLAALGVEPLEAPSPDEPLDFDPALGLSSDGAPSPVLQRPLGQRFDFLLVGPGPPGLVQQLRAAGLICGPVIDESVSRHFRLDCPDVTEWAMPVLSSLGVDSTRPRCLDRLGLTPDSGHQQKNFDSTPVLPRTRSNRARLLGLFDAWLADRGSSLSFLTAGSPLDPAAIGQALTSYGRDLYEAGRPYGDYSETVNAIGALCPSIRRQLQGPWDLAFAWMAAEPYTHHVPMPAALLLALLTCSLIWGWLREAGIFALAWGSLLRIGEATSARRGDLVLPEDVFGLHNYVLLSIREPKTRLRVARHQAAKLEQSDLVTLVCLAFGGLHNEERLWPRTNQTLRARLDKLLERLGVRPAGGQRAIDLGSFRPGGATHLLQLTEDSELVRRRGRWVSPKVMEIYLQEVSSIQFLPSQPPLVRAAVLKYAKAFPQVLSKVQQWSRQKVPPGAWYTLFSSSS